jgi:MtaA/CmuA family methyltransferase
MPVNSHERVMRRLRGQTVDRPPNFDIMMTFAAHYIGQPLSRYYQDYRVLGDATLAVQRAFDLDLVQTISDPYREAADMGAQIVFPEDDLPVCTQPLLAEPSDVHRLRIPDPHSGRRMSDRIAAAQYLKERAGDEVPVMGWVEGALAEAADLRGVSVLLLDLYDRPAWVRDLLELCVEVEIAFARAQIEAGAGIIGLGDAIASQIAPDMYREFALPYEKRIFAAVREMGAVGRLHICGNTTRILPYLAESGADIIDIEWMVDLERAAHVLGEYPATCGNFDPVAVMLQSTPDRVGEAVLRSLRAGGARNFSAASCEVPSGTPHANLRAQAAALRDYGQVLH